MSCGECSGTCNGTCGWFGLQSCTLGDDGNYFCWPSDMVLWIGVIVFVLLIVALIAVLVMRGRDDTPAVVSPTAPVVVAK